MRGHEFLKEMRTLTGQEGLTLEQAMGMKAQLEQELGSAMSFDETAQYFRGLDRAQGALGELEKRSKETLSDTGAGKGHHMDPLFRGSVVIEDTGRRATRGGFERPVEEEVEAHDS